MRPTNTNNRYAIFSHLFSLISIFFLLCFSCILISMEVTQNVLHILSYNGHLLLSSALNVSSVSLRKEESEHEVGED